MTRRQWTEYLRCARWELHGTTEAQQRWYFAAVRRHASTAAAAPWPEVEQLWPAMVLLLLSVAAYLAKLVDYLLLPGEWKK